MSDAASVTHPWEDFAIVMRHAEKARAADDLPRARVFFARALELNPEDAQAWAGNAATAPDSDEALISWGYALALAPGSLEAWTEIERLVTEKIAQENASAASLVASGRALAKVGHKQWAYRLLARATELEPLNVEAWLWRAGVTDDMAETTTCLQRVLELEPGNARAQAGLQWAQSQQAATPIPAAAREEASQLVENGQQLLKVGDQMSAYDLFRRATELDPRSESAWFWRGSTAPNLEDQLVCMGQTLSLNPDNEAAKEAVWWLRVKQLRERVKTSG